MTSLLRRLYGLDSPFIRPTCCKAWYAGLTQVTGRHHLERDLPGLCPCVAGRGTDRSQAKARGHPREQHRRGASRPLAEQALRHRMSSAELPCFSHRTRQARCRRGDRRRWRQVAEIRSCAQEERSGGTAMPTTQGPTPLEAVNEIRNDDNGQVVLVLQGGGALGAYQGGVYQALHEAGVEPDWLIGTSIGAINASLIAGNKVEDRLPKLKEFWRRIQVQDELLGGVSGLDRHRRSSLVMDNADERHPRLLRGQSTRLPRGPAHSVSTTPPANRSGSSILSLIRVSLAQRLGRTRSR